MQAPLFFPSITSPNAERPDYPPFFERRDKPILANGHPGQAGLPPFALLLANVPLMSYCRAFSIGDNLSFR